MRRRPASHAFRVLLAPLALAACSSAGPSASSVRALHFGDFGEVTPSQAAVARAMAAEARRTPVDLAIAAGDNLYECGVDPRLPGAGACAFAPDGNTVAEGFTAPLDPRFATLHEQPLADLSTHGAPVPVWLVLGNHDVAAQGGCAAGPDPVAVARTKACLQVAHSSPRWSMPGRHWVHDAGPARFIGIDSNLLKADYGGFAIDGEVAFVRAAAAPCSSRTCFVVAHHPPVSAGEHRDDATPDYLARVARIEEAAGGRIAAWLSAHEHQLEHLRTLRGTDVLVSGSSARPRPSETFSAVSVAGAPLLFASTTVGYGVLTARGDGWSYRFADPEGRPLHCCEAIAGGPCGPVACAP